MQVLNPDPAGPADKPLFESISLTGLTGPLGGGSKVNTSLSPFSNNQADSNATPIVQIQPQYPVDAARKGLEGWVKLSFSIDKTGSVSQVQVLDSSPARVFDNAARRALKRWRYKAKFVNGVPMIQDNLQVQLDFTLDQ